jgi:site-specific DNA recombinase
MNFANSIGHRSSGTAPAPWLYWTTAGVFAACANAVDSFSTTSAGLRGSRFQLVKHFECSHVQAVGSAFRERIGVAPPHLIEVRMIKDPDIGKRLSRPNAKNDWQTADVPDLRIISQKLFDDAQSRKQARGITHPNHQRRPRHMLSGLLRCGACGSGMSTNGKDKSGRIRIRCSAATESGACRDAKTFYLTTVEGAVLAGLKAEMRHPSVIAEYVRTYHDERKRLSAKTNARRAHLELRLGEFKREIDRLVDAIAKGHGDPAVLGPRSSILDEERKQVAKELNAEPTVDDVISFHPAVLARYEQQLAHLQDALSKGVNAGDSEAAEAIRDLVETVTVFRNPSHPGGVTVEIVGRLNALLGEQAYPHNVRGAWGKVVAREGLEPPTPGL